MARGYRMGGTQAKPKEVNLINNANYHYTSTMSGSTSGGSKIQPDGLLSPTVRMGQTGTGGTTIICTFISDTAIDLSRNNLLNIVGTCTVNHSGGLGGDKYTRIKLVNGDTQVVLFEKISGQNGVSTPINVNFDISTYGDDWKLRFESNTYSNASYDFSFDTFELA